MTQNGIYTFNPKLDPSIHPFSLLFLSRALGLRTPSAVALVVLAQWP